MLRGKAPMRPMSSIPRRSEGQLNDVSTPTSPREYAQRTHPEEYSTRERPNEGIGNASEGLLIRWQIHSNASRKQLDKAGDCNSDLQNGLSVQDKTTSKNRGAYFQEDTTHT